MKPCDSAMYHFHSGVLDLPSEDILDIKNLSRWDLTFFSHPKSDFIENLKVFDTQGYVIDGTIYGCFINSAESDGKLKVMIVWFGFYQKDNLIIPDSYVDFQDILDFCEAEKIENFLYHLNVLGGASNFESN